MNTKNLFIHSDGLVQAVGDIPLELGTVTEWRASNVVPVHRGKRFVFFALRAVFGERGKVAEWTRSWQGPWTATLFQTGETYTAQSRKVVLQWEHERLENLLSQ